MAQITINEISQNYLWSVGTSSFATVALPITASWGPGFVDPEILFSNTEAKSSDETVLETLGWQRFPATQAGLESFISTYRGPSSNYRLAKDYSFQMAQTLLAAGYDILVCRLCPGVKAEGTFTVSSSTESTETESTETESTEAGTLSLKAKYPGTFGNNLMATLRKVPNRNYYNLVTYVKDESGTRTAVENLLFVFNVENSTDSILHIDEINSSFLDIVVDGISSDDVAFAEESVDLVGGTDKAQSKEGDTAETILKAAKALAVTRYKTVNQGTGAYVTAFDALIAKEAFDITRAYVILYKEWLYTKVLDIYELLKDRLTYSPQRIISPGWDDQNFPELTGEPYTPRFDTISPIHAKLMDVAYYSRCGTALLDVPKSLAKKYVYNESDDDAARGYAQILARYVPATSTFDLNASLYSSHSALNAPWGNYTYVGTSKKNTASPSFLVLMIQRAMILNQAAQYEWALPTKRTHRLDVGKLDYPITKKELDEWQKLEGVGVNIITSVPDLGMTLWGNSTLFEVPPATYQALANLSTRYLVNAVKDVVYRCGIQITFSYNNQDAYSAFYAGVTPLLDQMRNIGAINGYRIEMSADIDANDRINANTIIGKIWLTIQGVTQNIDIDLIALPPNASLDAVM